MRVKQRQSWKRQINNLDIHRLAMVDFEALRKEFLSLENSRCLFVNISSQRSWGSRKAVWVLLKGPSSPWYTNTCYSCPFSRSAFKLYFHCRFEDVITAISPFGPPVKINLLFRQQVTVPLLGIDLSNIIVAQPYGFCFGLYLARWIDRALERSFNVFKTMT